jgi:succinoglycan biosynthesis protein ExoV
MKLHYRAIPGGNFGDDLNLLLWPEIFPDLHEHHPAATLYGIGTILGGEHDPSALKIVLGSGLGYRGTPKLDETWDIRWVRGPYSAQLLGLAPDKALGDGALLWSGLAPTTNPSPDGIVGLIPHHATWESFDWPSVAAQSGMLAVDPKLSPGDVAAQMGRCSRILTESLHGAIFADAMGIPWAACVLSHRFNEFKWNDWLAGIERPFDACVSDRPLVATLDRGKALSNRLARWTGLGGRARRNELRAVAPATTADVAHVAATLTGFGRNAANFRCSDRAVVSRQKQRMRQACADFARQYGLRFRP